MDLSISLNLDNRAVLSYLLVWNIYEPRTSRVE